MFKKKELEEERPEPQAASRKYSPPQTSALPSPELISWGWMSTGTGLKWLHHLVREESLSCPFCLCSSGKEKGKKKKTCFIQGDP